MGQRLDLVVAQRFGLSRRAAREAVLNGRVDLDGQTCREPGQVVEAPESVRFDPNRPRVRRVQGAGLEVLHEDRHLIVVAKPAGLLTLPTADHESDTLVERVRRYLAIRYGGRPYVGIAHRLDRDTSGALVLARSSEALGLLQDLFREHAVEREYLAVVAGIPRDDQATIDLPLADEPGQVRRRVAALEAGGRAARTHYRVIERFGRKAALLACRLETGRTHQVRVHLAGIGHPVVGDPLYRARRGTSVTFRRQALHARTLGFAHPLEAGGAIRVEAPLPADLAALLARLRRGASRPPEARRPDRYFEGT